MTTKVQEEAELLGLVGQMLEQGEEAAPTVGPSPDGQVSVASGSDTKVVYAWHTRTGERVPIIVTPQNLAKQFSKKFTDGTKVFSQTPVDPPKRRKLLCYMNPNRDDAETYSQFITEACPKSNLPNEGELRLHMERFHPSEWAAIREERDALERQLTRQDQKQATDAMLKMARASTRGRTATRKRGKEPTNNGD